MKTIEYILNLSGQPLLFGLALGLFIITTLWLFLLYRRPAFASLKKNWVLPEEVPGVSVILCVRNEYESLATLLPALLEQKYPKFQIVVVNKNSEDDTEVLLASLEHFHKNLTVRNITANRKFGDDSLMALGLGLRAAEHPYVVFFRPDFLPASDRWLEGLVKTGIHRKSETAIGYLMLSQNRLRVRYHFQEQQLHQMALSDLGMPYAYTGVNVLFPKKYFTENKNFKTATTAYNRCEQAIVAHTLLHAEDAERKAAACTYPQSTLISTRRIPVSEYRFSHVQSLRTLVSTKGWPYFLQIPEKLLIAAFYGIIILSFVNTFPWNHLWHWVFPAGLVLLRWIAVWSHHIGYRIHLGDKNLFYTAPLWDIFAPFSYFRYLILLLFKKIWSN